MFIFFTWEVKRGSNHETTKTKVTSVICEHRGISLGRREGKQKEEKQSE